MMDFNKFQIAVNKQFDKMSKGVLYCTDVTKEDLWETYLASFPAGTNEIFRERREYDCSCCRQFIRLVGNMVAIEDGEVVSIWDGIKTGEHFDTVAKAMSALVKSAPIRDQFLHYDVKIGTEKNFETVDGKTVTWAHFFLNLPHGANDGYRPIAAKKDIDTKLGEIRGRVDVFRNGLAKLTQDAVDTVADIVRQGSLYRGHEYAGSLDGFQKLKRAHDKLPPEKRDAFVWAHALAKGASIKNAAIGVLLEYLSGGMDLEVAVKKYESSIVGADTFKRPTALVSQVMVDKAKAAIAELGLTSALERRYAHLSDINVNDVLFSDVSAKSLMKNDDPFAKVANKPSTPKSTSKIETISMEKFIADVVPNVTSIEVLLENKHVSNLVSLIAPVHKNAGQLFKWQNGFSWTYNGDVADSIKEKVKKAGGNVTGDLCCRLAWFNYDDLDLHMNEAGGFHLFFGTKFSHFTGGKLDVDKNAGDGYTREPVENIFYGDRKKMKEGVYTLSVHQYQRRESDNVGFEVEIDYLGTVYSYAYPKSLTTGATIQIAKFKYSHAKGIEFIESLPVSSATRQVWGLKTNEYHKVNVMMRSPNYWEGEKGTGNQHYFFMLDGCANDGEVRGFFNEFLRPELEPHRKVIEIVGSKMRTAFVEDQLSGLGFSDTKHTEIQVRVKGSFNRTLNVQI